MVYLLKFGASWILPPGIFIVLAAFLTFKLTRINIKLAALVGAGTLIFYLMCTNFVADFFVGKLEKAYSPPENVETCGADSVIMLGGGAIPDVPDVDGEGTLCSAPANRILTAARLQRKLDLPIILSGGQVYEDSGKEAVIGARILTSLGVPAEKIFTETRSVNTTQNAKFTAEILREKNLTRPVLVTSAFHMRRAVLNFERQGVEVIPYPSDFFVPRRPHFHYTKLRPSAEALFYNAVVFQEVLRSFVTDIFNV